ncbi:hypothetical protein [Thermobrachium celere]|uniref:hypothetical protein n=1 Tax=Thermobrachium celere TaxID=53422 RepID=UPI0019455EA6|nr:hypothetical protein [Thermobrachium celere]GFR35127.1 hypothetical protein TCEA9_09390 [Thermobrachium celere]
MTLKKSLCIDSRKIEKSKEIVQIICSKISKTRIGDGTERYINDIKQEVIEEINNTKLNRIIYKIIMSINLIGLLIVLMILEGKSPILTNKYFKVVSLLVYFINGAFSLYLRLKFKNVPSYKIIFNIGIILSVLIIIMLIV